MKEKSDNLLDLAVDTACMSGRQVIWKTDEKTLSCRKMWHRADPFEDRIKLFVKIRFLARSLKAQELLKKSYLSIILYYYTKLTSKSS